MSTLDRYDVDPMLGCHVWRGATNDKGYPMMWHEGRTRQVRHVVWEAERGPIPSGHVLRNECGQRACIWPAHQTCVPASVAARAAAQRPRARAARGARAPTRD